MPRGTEEGRPGASSRLVEVDARGDGEHGAKLDAISPAVSGARWGGSGVEEDEAGLVVRDAGVDGADAEGHLEQSDDVQGTHGRDDGVEVRLREVVGAELGVERVEGHAGWIRDEAVVVEVRGDGGVLQEGVVEAEVAVDVPLRDELELGRGGGELLRELAE